LLLGPDHFLAAVLISMVLQRWYCMPSLLSTI